MSLQSRPDFLQFGERPLGTDENKRATEFLRAAAAGLGYQIRSLPFACVRWEHGESLVLRGGARLRIHAGAYSQPFEGTAECVSAQSLQDLERGEFAGRILLLSGEIAAEPLMPKDFPFYFPEEHRAVYSALEAKRPAAILAVTGKHPSCGLSPFPLITDGSFPIPSAYCDEKSATDLLSHEGPVTLAIDSHVVPAAGEQLVAFRKGTEPGAGRVIVCAHMDTAYDTPGALDNAAGVLMLLETMQCLRDWSGRYDLEFVPFNGEDSYGVCGQLAYLSSQKAGLEDVRCAVNVDAAGLKGSRTAVSCYNFDEAALATLDRVIARHQSLERGPEWVEGDHSIFAFQGIPTLALTSSELRTVVMALSHTPEDTADKVDVELLRRGGEFVADYLGGL